MDAMRYRSLDALRGLACLMVVVFHSTFLVSASTVASASDPASYLISIAERLWIGVPMFFVISGYCISATADNARRKGHSVRVFFARRFRRIFPPYLICVAVSAAAVALLDPLYPGLFRMNGRGMPLPTELNVSQWLANLTLTNGWVCHFTGEGRLWFLGTAWTLGYEEQFYGLTGLLLLLAPRHFFAGAAVITAAVVAASPWRDSTRGFFFDGHWLQFAAGIGVYYVAAYANRWQTVAIVLALLAGLAWSARTPSLLLSEVAQPEQFYFVAYGLALLLMAGHRLDAQIADAPVLWPLNVCGVMCYSLYLVHGPICVALSTVLFDAGLRSPTATVLVTVPLCIAASVLAGWLFHIAVERRFLNSQRP
jgi:peptidoglycan/LPS O-acetylase OafA/YrhL